MESHYDGQSLRLRKSKMFKICVSPFRVCKLPERFGGSAGQVELEGGQKRHLQAKVSLSGASLARFHQLWHQNKEALQGSFLFEQNKLSGSLRELRGSGAIRACSRSGESKSRCGWRHGESKYYFKRVKTQKHWV